MEDSPNYTPKDFYNQSEPQVNFSLNRKRQIINATLNELHSIQLDMIDEAVEYSDMSEAREVINYIRSL
jgi:hypothetical protein